MTKLAGSTARLKPCPFKTRCVTGSVTHYSSLNSREMFPAPGLQGMRFAVWGLQLDRAAARDFADAGDRSAGTPGRNALIGRSGEEQFVIFAAMQGVLQFGVAFYEWERGGVRSEEH